MCVCNGTGIVHKEIYPGMVTIDGCNCEVAKQQQRDYKKRWAEWTERFEAMEREVEAKQKKQAS